MAFYVWLGIALLLFVLEIVIFSTFALLCFAVGSVVAALVSLFGLNEIWQVIGFAVSSLLLFIFIRPILLNRLDKRSQSRPKTNAEALIGRIAKVVEPIEEHSPGRVIVDGDNWQAVSSDNQPVKIGEKVVIEGIDSIILSVKRINDISSGKSSADNF